MIESLTEVSNLIGCNELPRTQGGGGGVSQVLPDSVEDVNFLSWGGTSWMIRVSTSSFISLISRQDMKS